MPSITFSATLPVKPSATITSAAPLPTAKPSRLPTKFSAPRAVGEGGVGGHDLLGPLARLLAVGEQRHARARDPHRDLHEGGAHVRELHEVLGPDLDVGARVEQQEGRAGNRHQHGERRAVDAAPALDPEQRGGQRGAGGPACHERVRAAVGDRRDGLDDRGLRVGAHGARGILGLGDRVRGVDDLDALARLPELRRGAVQQHAQAAGRGQRGAARHLGGAQIGPVRVHRDRDRRGHQ